MNNPRDNDIFQQIRAIVIRTFRLPEDTAIRPETTSADIEGWDSLSHALLIMNIEEAVHADLPLDRIYAVKNIGELVDLVHETVATNA